MQNELLFPIQPELTTERLILRPMQLKDGPTIHRLVNDKDIAYDCVNIPYPYPEGAAEAWITGHPWRFLQAQAAIFAITKDKEIIGACGIEFRFDVGRYDLGYWIGKEFWRHGYATEAATALLNYGLNEWKLAEVYAESLSSNQASCRVLEKIGMQREARISKPCHPPYIKEEDVDVYCIRRATKTELEVEPASDG